MHRSFFAFNVCVHCRAFLRNAIPRRLTQTPYNIYLMVCRFGYLTDDETETPICNQNGTLGVSTNVGDYRDAHARYKVQDRIGLRC